MPPNMWKNPKKYDKLGVLSPVPVDNCVDNVDFCITHTVNIHFEHTVYVHCCNKFQAVTGNGTTGAGKRLRTENAAASTSLPVAKGQPVNTPPSAAAGSSRVWRQIAAAACATGRASTCFRSKATFKSP